MMGYPSIANDSLAFTPIFVVPNFFIAGSIRFWGGWLDWSARLIACRQANTQCTTNKKR
jgi:hypothetical protein